MTNHFMKTVICGLALSLSNVNADNQVIIDGSTTVYPLTEKISHEFAKTSDGFAVQLSKSSSGNGLSQLCAGRIDIAQASRPINAAELQRCQAQQIDFIELPVAFDAVVFVVSRDNTWLHEIRVAELKQLWQASSEGSLQRWQQLRPEWPDEPITLLRSEVGSGTYDFVTEAIVGTEGVSRNDVETIDSNAHRIRRIAEDPLSLGYVSFSYYLAYADKLRAIAIDDEDDSNGVGAQEPNLENIRNNTYRPLSRPLFLYIAQRSAERPEVQTFMHYYLQQAGSTTLRAGGVPLLPAAYESAKQRFTQGKTGVLFGGNGARHDIGLNTLADMALEDLLKIDLSD